MSQRTEDGVVKPGSRLVSGDIRRRPDRPGTQTERGAGPGETGEDVVEGTWVTVTQCTSLDTGDVRVVEVERRARGCGTGGFRNTYTYSLTSFPTAQPTRSSVPVLHGPAVSRSRPTPGPTVQPPDPSDHRGTFASVGNPGRHYV